MLDESRRCSEGFCRDRASLRGHGNNEARVVSAAENISPRPGRQSTVVTVAGTRAMNLPEGAETSSILIRGPCTRKSRKSPKSEDAKGSPSQTAISGRGTIPPTPTPGFGEERMRNPQAQMRKIPLSSTGMILLDPLTSCSVAGSGERDRKSAFPLALPLRYSRV